MTKRGTSRTATFKDFSLMLLRSQNTNLRGMDTAIQKFKQQKIKRRALLRTANLRKDL